MGLHENILLADDSRIARELVREDLETNGHMVVAEASGVSEAKKIIDNPEIKFRVAVLDGAMPEFGDGERVAAYIKGHRPEAKIVSLSGDKQQWGDLNLDKIDGWKPLLDYLQSLPD